jgi:hypothetical protein
MPPVYLAACLMGTRATLIRRHLHHPPYLPARNDNRPHPTEWR